MIRPAAAIALALAASCSRPSPKPAAWAPAKSCNGCHAEIAKSYARTGMGRAFAPFSRERTKATFDRTNVFYHKASDRTYTMTLRDGTAYMRRQEGPPGGPERNVVEKRIDYILGSGHAAQTFVHRNARDELIELPVAWYVEGGYWAMNPNYDRPDHEEFRRRISYDCFFCHNAYPNMAGRSDSFFADPVYPADLPSGIDCQRCHGSAAAHVEAASSGAPVEKIRAGVVNPKRLGRDRRMEICMQCHLQSTSRSLPHAVVREGRGVFSYGANEPLGGFVTHFDHAPGSGYDDKFEIAHAAYQLRKSACFQKSEMDCVTCHDPHAVKRGAEAVAETSAACRQCHHSPAGAMHAKASECVSCHMPKRRTEDVVEVVMNDHRIVRRPPPGNLTARRAERDTRAYRGEVVPYYPPRPDVLSVALAQVRAGANLGPGIAALENAIGKDCGADCYYDLAEAYGKAGRTAGVARAAEEALRLDPNHVAALRSYGAYLSANGDAARGAELLERALRLSPGSARTMHDLAANYERQGRSAESLKMLREAAAADLDSPEILVALGMALNAAGQSGEAMNAFAGAVRAEPRNAAARYGYAVTLAQAGRKGEALDEATRASELEPSRADARLLVAMLSAELGDLGRARIEAAKAAAAKDQAIADQARGLLRALNQ
ncbi:MAG: tetratricopeptide repeat protein [Bryobacteraceae bacterium]